MKPKYLIIFLTALAAISCSKDGGKAAVNVSVSPSELEAPHTVSSQTFDVQSDGAWTVRALWEDGTELAWVSLGRTKGNGNAKVSVRVYKNEYSNPRTAKLTVTSETGNEAVVTLVQAGDPESTIVGNVLTTRIGTFNVRVVNAGDTGENAWENRKTRVVQSISDCDFDVFGVNECSTEIQTYLADQLKNGYTCKFFSPYAQNGKGNKAQGIIYKKEYTLSDWHYFWLSTSPDKMCTNDISGGSKYNRGGCCAILTHNDTGIKMFVMVTHGALNDTTRDNFAYLYAQMEKKYNPKGYPSFFVGDMNASPTSAATLVYREYWKDARLNAAKVEGPLATYNGFDPAASLSKESKRIDYIYYKNATPLTYVCSDKKYGGYWASDHLPLYSDMKIETTVE